MKRLLFPLLLAGLLAGCVTSGMVTNPVVSRLKNRGPVAVSSDNPFVASNMMLQKTMDESAEVKGFVEHRGAPSVVEVKQDLISSPSMFFYYPENGEYYSLENDDAFWIIEGPFPIDEKTLKALQPITLVQLSTQEKIQHPVGVQKPAAPAAVGREEILSEKKKEREKAPPLDEEEKMIPLEKNAEPIALSDSQKPAPAAELPSQPQRPSSPRSAPARQAASSTEHAARAGEDERIVREILASATPASGEITPKGDLVHYVTFPEEDLALVARWYTYDAWNAGKIARVSGISQKQPLSVGDTLVIPSYLLKNKSRLSQEGLSALRQSGR